MTPKEFEALKNGTISQEDFERLWRESEERYIGKDKYDHLKEE